MPAERGKGVAYCLQCGYEATQEEVDAGIHACPGCGEARALPAWRKDDVTVRVNWHELRILVMWAEHWVSAQKEEDRRGMQKTLYGIADRLHSQHLSRDPLTFVGELTQLREHFGEVEVTGFNEPPLEDAS
jgi:DNA-directed RNA polymerase subunit RPC12/RpoP